MSYRKCYLRKLYLCPATPYKTYKCKRNGRKSRSGLAPRGHKPNAQGTFSFVLKVLFPTDQFSQGIFLSLHTNKQALVLDIHFLRSLGGFIFLLITFKLRKYCVFGLKWVVSWVMMLVILSLVLSLRGSTILLLTVKEEFEGICW